MSGPRRILVTGASRGLGRALVEHFLQSGDIVTGCARSSSDLVHERYAHVRADVGVEADVTRLFAELRERCGGLDVLVNNLRAMNRQMHRHTHELDITRLGYPFNRSTG
jgi:3-oxoacyl-[acyl-carrier protein] reductase